MPITRYHPRRMALREPQLPRPKELWVNVSRTSPRKHLVYRIRWVTAERVTAHCAVTGARRVLQSHSFLQGEYGRVPPRWRQDAIQLADRKLKEIQACKKRSLRRLM